uniref:Zmp:0000001267 n=1 Tax=Cyprinus carpio TaxID=7962 RepID=A0A8C2BYG7_CYPCA
KVIQLLTNRRVPSWSAKNFSEMVDEAGIRLDNWVILTCVSVIATASLQNINFTIAAQAVFMVERFVCLMIIVIGGIITLLQGNYESLLNLESAFADTKLGISTVGMALYQCLWSYAGWYNLNNVTEEVKRPEVNLPRALMIAIPMVTILYLLVNVSYLAVMTPTEMISSSAVAVTWGNKVLGGWGWVMSVAAALSAFGSLNGSFFSGGRMCYVAAREGHMPDILAMAHMRRLTPSPALIFNTIIALIVLILGEFQAIVNYFRYSCIALFFHLKVLVITCQINQISEIFPSHIFDFAHIFFLKENFVEGQFSPEIQSNITGGLK